MFDKRVGRKLAVDSSGKPIKGATPEAVLQQAELHRAHLPDLPDTIPVKTQPSRQRNEARRYWFGKTPETMKGQLLESARKRGDTLDLADGTYVRIGDSWVHESHLDVGHRYDASVWATHVGQYLPGGKNDPAARAFRTSSSNYFLQPLDGPSGNRASGASGSLPYPPKPTSLPPIAQPPEAAAAWQAYISKRAAELRSLGIE